MINILPDDRLYELHKAYGTHLKPADMHNTGAYIQGISCTYGIVACSCGRHFGYYTLDTWSGKTYHSFDTDYGHALLMWGIKLLGNTDLAARIKAEHDQPKAR